MFRQYKTIRGFCQPVWLRGRVSTVSNSSDSKTYDSSLSWTSTKDLAWWSQNWLPGVPSSPLLSSPLLMEQIVDFKLNYPFCSLVTLVKWDSSSTKTSPYGIIEQNKQYFKSYWYIILLLNWLKFSNLDDIFLDYNHIRMLSLE